ncbi:hypothetical protein NQ318_013042 [Aromia moschata]|uniref:Transposase n=1 Tax=Aromia moschata TaxID=1265417 RepID=A0AAV8Y4D8_9CUCU|nr:hypothetical protein NQ318_013042 [Aromia moschata]
MVYLTEMHKITILQMIGYGDRTRTQAEVVRRFQEKISGVAADTSRYRKISIMGDRNPPLTDHELWRALYEESNGNEEEVAVDKSDSEDEDGSLADDQEEDEFTQEEPEGEVPSEDEVLQEFVADRAKDQDFDFRENLDNQFGIFLDIPRNYQLKPLQNVHGGVIFVQEFVPGKDVIFVFTVITLSSTVSKIESKFRETGDVKDLPKSGRPKITQDKKINIVLCKYGREPLRDDKRTNDDDKRTVKMRNDDDDSIEKKRIGDIGNKPQE